MPNWCMNKLMVSGNAAELKRFVESSMGFPAHYPPQEWEKLIRQMDLPEDTPYFVSMRSFQRLRKSWRRVILRITNSLRTLCCTH